MSPRIFAIKYIPGTMDKPSLHEGLLASTRDGGAPLSPGCISWEAIFYVNVFFACISFSIVMPSLYLYVTAMDASPTLYALIVATYSVGEGVGSLLLGALSNHIGTKRTMQLCATSSFVGSVSYALADVIYHHLGAASVAPYVVLFGRAMQGMGSGGQQATEQAYFSIAAPIEERTVLTGRLGTFACLGFIFGPAIGAFVASVLPDAQLGAVELNSFTKVGWIVALLDVTRYCMTTCFFVEICRDSQQSMEEQEGAKGETAEADSAGAAVGGNRADDGTGEANEHASWAVWALMFFFFVHFNGFAIRTPRPAAPLPGM